MRPAVLIIVCVVFAAACGGSGRTPLLAEGRDLYTGKGCVACHGGRGEGGVGPALSQVAAVFPSCDTHLEWVRLGAVKWVEAHGPTYGTGGTVDKGVMPSSDDTMTDGERRTVVAYERIEFGGLDEDAVRTDCGLGGATDPGGG